MAAGGQVGLFDVQGRAKIAALKERNRELQARSESQTATAAKKRIEQRFGAVTKGLSAVELLQKAIALWRDGAYTDPRRALEYLDRAIRLAPDDAIAFNNRGVAYAALGQYDRAIRDAKRACSLGSCRILEFLKSKGLVR